MRLLIGPGGQGKTRLARHLAHQLLSQPPPTTTGRGWVCGFLTADTADADLAAARRHRCAAAAAGRLRRDPHRSSCGGCCQLLWDADTSEPVRVLLLARGAGEWWTQLSRDLDGEPGEVIALGALDPVEDRAAQFAAAVAAFARHLDDGVPGDAAAAAAPSAAPPPGLGHARYGSPLTLAAGRAHRPAANHDSP